MMAASDPVCALVGMPTLHLPRVDAARSSLSARARHSCAHFFPCGIVNPLYNGAAQRSNCAARSISLAVNAYLLCDLMAWGECPSCRQFFCLNRPSRIGSCCSRACARSLERREGPTKLDQAEAIVRALRMELERGNPFLQIQSYKSEQYSEK